VQPQCRYCGVKVIDDMQSLGINGLLKIAKELLDAGESRPWNKRTDEEVILLAFDSHLANLALLTIQQINDLLGILLHG
jgi:hypothetical protein